MANDQCKIIRAEIMLFLLVVYFLAFFVVRKYLLGFPRNKTPEILATQITMTQVHEMDSNLHQLKRKLSFCKSIESRPIQVINIYIIIEKSLYQMFNSRRLQNAIYQKIY